MKLLDFESNPLSVKGGNKRKVKLVSTHYLLKLGRKLKIVKLDIRKMSIYCLDKNMLRRMVTKNCINYLDIFSEPNYFK